MLVASHCSKGLKKIRINRLKLRSPQTIWGSLGKEFQKEGTSAGMAVVYQSRCWTSISRGTQCRAHLMIWRHQAEHMEGSVPLRTEDLAKKCVSYFVCAVVYTLGSQLQLPSICIWTEVCPYAYDSCKLQASLTKNILCITCVFLKCSARGPSSVVSHLFSTRASFLGATPAKT